MLPAHAPTLRRPLPIPLDALTARVGSWDRPALLEGGASFGEGGRWSLLAARPRAILESLDGRETTWTGPELGLGAGIDALEALDRVAKHFGLADPSERPDPDAPPFQGGLIGFLGYDLAPTLERLPRKAGVDSRIPALRFGLYDTFVAIDHRSRTAELWAVDLLGEGETAVQDRAERWRNDLETPSRKLSPSALSAPAAELARRDYVRAVERILDYIAAGDIYQANLSHRFVARGRVTPLDLYHRLRRLSPSPYSAFLAWDDLAVLSASPELFFRAEGDRLLTRPIKGTRPRKADPVEDRRQVRELEASLKDRAELTMIVDLERNDLGRVCRPGSVRVVDPGSVESYEQVHHRVATVEGRLAGRPSLVDVFRAMFPGGSITGAPKIRAMEIIDELEPCRRSLYTGAVGFLSRRGVAEFNIAIRTMLVEGDRVSFQVGGGIVADSDPEAEYRETLDKARGMLAVIEECRGLP